LYYRTGWKTFVGFWCLSRNRYYWDFDSVTKWNYQITEVPKSWQEHFTLQDQAVQVQFLRHY
jgi:hypothetical protein